MMPDSRRAIVVLALLALTPAASTGQTRQPQPARPATNAPLTFRGFGDAGATVFTATQSFTTILGRPSGAVFGGGVELVLPPHLFLSVAASRFSRGGHRVFVFEGQVFDLNVPTTITVTPLEVTIGYRFTRPPPRAGTRRRVVPYAGGGVGWHKYHETSGHSTDTDDVSRTFTGYHVLGGADVPMTKWIAAAAEAQWASVPNALGNDPHAVSSLYNEHNLGGFTFRMKVIVGR